MHRNTFINLTGRIKRKYGIDFTTKHTVCGTKTGVEGYVESAASGLVVVSILAKILGKVR